MARRNPPAKWVLPDVVHPPDYLCFKIPVPNNPYYIAAFRGALLNLASAAKWGDDPAHTALQVAQVWKDIYDQVIGIPCINPTPVPAGTSIEINPMEGLFQVICDESGNCKAQYRCDICSPWQDLVNTTDLIANPPGTGNQPLPGGGTADYCKTVPANGGVIVPTPVNTGDLITVLSATGDWSDGSGLLNQCVDGNDFFISCTGVGGATMGGDPASGAFHMSLVVQFSTGAYALYPGGSLTVPAGVTNEQPLLIANKATPNSGRGAIDVCVRITNNSVATWSHTFDLTAAPGPFSPVTGPYTGTPGHWSPGNGWVGDDVLVGSDAYRILDLECVTPIPHLTTIKCSGIYACGTLTIESGYTSRVNGTNEEHIVGCLPDGPFSKGIDFAQVASTNIEIFSNVCALSSCPGGAVTYTKIILGGNGVDPF